MFLHSAEFAKWQRQRSQFEQTVRRFDSGFIQPTNPGTETDGQPLTEAQKKERKRQLNVIHSRQKRERRKTEADDLKTQAVALEKQNKGLQSENARLEGLWVEATRRVGAMGQGYGAEAAPHAPQNNVLQDALANGTSEFHQQLAARQLLLNHAMRVGSNLQSPTFPPINASANGTQQLPVVNSFDPSITSMGLGSNLPLSGPMHIDHGQSSTALYTSFANPSSAQAYSALGNRDNSINAAALFMSSHPQFRQLQQQQHVQAPPAPMQNMDLAHFLSSNDGADNNGTFN